MGLFGKKSEGGILDVIRCDEQEYLIWKWRPSGEALSTNKENAIRWGSSLRVKDGEIAVFVYKQKGDGPNQEFIEGPHDDTIKTSNFPIISNIIGLAYAGQSPFQAEIYFINTAGNVQIKFGIPYFDVYDPRFNDFGVPVAARGTLTFNITNYKAFIKLTRMINFELDNFKQQIKDMVTKNVKGIITNIPQDHNMPAIQLERRILDISDIIEKRLKVSMEEDFGINLKRLDLATIEFDKESEEYQKLIKVTREQQEKTTVAQTDVGIKNLEDTQEINAKNMDESLRIQREEMQRSQKLQTETMNMGAHQLNQQTEVAKTAAESMGKMGQGGAGGAGGTMDPGSMMASMAMGTAVGGGMAGMMGNMMQGMNQQQNTPPPSPENSYLVAVAGKQAGPFSLQQLTQFVSTGEFNKDTDVWKQGMDNWKKAGEVTELTGLFNNSNDGNTNPPPLSPQDAPPPPPPTNPENK
ncbi:SPFH domain-containing protein [bacterium]|jgi:membrane protease subunit (stomatin/prohibitin family)|nr:SPFH domain-containing protein [bacterium]